MLRGNLATRPFYNERVVSLVLLAVAAAVAVLTAFNASQLSALWSDRTRLRGEIARDEAEVARVLGDVEGPSEPIDPATLARLALGTTEANALIDRRAFSWTAFFDVMEDVLPFDVRLIAVTHRIEEGDLLLVLTVNARDHDDLNALVTGMLGTGRFLDVLPTEERAEEDDSINATIETYYVPPVRTAEAPVGDAPEGGGP